MVTEQELLDFMRETAYKPMTYQELEQHWGTEDAEEIKSFFEASESARGVGPNFAYAQ